MSVEERLHELGIELPEPPPPAGNYIGAVSVGNLLFLSGHGPRGADGEYSSGKLGSDFTLEQGQEEARKVGINMLATLKVEIGDLNRVRRVVKVLGMVNAVPEFRDHPSVINGFSDFMVEVFGTNPPYGAAVSYCNSENWPGSATCPLTWRPRSAT